MKYEKAGIQVNTCQKSPEPLILKGLTAYYVLIPSQVTILYIDSISFFDV